MRACEVVEEKDERRHVPRRRHYIGVGRIDGRRRLDALVFPQQARMRLLEVGERGCQPGGVVFKALPLPEPCV